MTASQILRRAVWITAALAAAQSANAQTAPAQDTGELATVIVTGSLIKRTDTETPSPVQVISEQDLQNSGYTNVSDVLRNLAANGQGTLNQAFGQAFAAGGSGIALRGLTVGGTLTLIDSERMVAYPLSDDLERSFVDITAIPFNAIESVEVLKDGASALYGADAIAGVVNIKLKRTYVGAEITAEGGTSQHRDGTTEHLAGIIGWGDLSNDGYNLYAAIDWHHTDAILGSNRHAGFTTLDWSNLPGGQNTRPGAIGAAGLAYPDSVTGYLVNPNTSSGKPYAFLPGCTQALQNLDDCAFNFPGQIQAPSAQTNFLAKFTKGLVNDWTVTFTGSLFDSIAEQVAATFPFGHAFSNTGQEAGSITNITGSPGQLFSTVVFPVLSLPANSPLNPFGKPANLVYSFPDLGPAVTDVETTTYRFFADVRGTAAGWDLDGQVGIMYARMSDQISGYIEPALAQAALNSGAYIPGVSTNGTALFAPPLNSSPTSTLDIVDVHGSRELFQLPGGPLALGAGVQYSHRAQNDQNAPNIVSGVQESPGPAYSVGSQNASAVFLELDGKVIKQLELNAAVRYDHYDTYGGQATPKVGFKFTPIEMIALRGTWGKGFRAPSISESGTAGLAFGQGNGFDPVLCPKGILNVKGTFNALCSYPVVGVAGANPNLKAVTSTNETLGVIFEPFKQFNVSVDWYRIELTNDIISASSAGGLSNFVTGVRGPSARLPECTNTTTGGVPCATVNAPTPVGYPAYNLYPYLNAGSTRTSGVDVDMRSFVNIGDSKLSAELNYTYISQYEITVTGITYDLAGTHGPSTVSGDTGNPKSRATASLTWQRGPANITASVNYTGPFNITDPSTNYNNCIEALHGRSPSAYGSALQSSVTTLPSAWYQFCSVHSFLDTNLYASYTIGDHLNIHGSIVNLFNVSPPIDLQTYGGGAELAYDAALHQDGAVGRFFLVGATYKF
ncbi:MAG TPA: TonB-dependent receptor [Steroidobacteraceae bacterium]|jgi:iron complex outermembrane receptor protein|nr:TonB-dependent receptor [Steroidobacteraceae bacterium]